MLNITQITDDLTLLTDWEDKYSYIIDLGRDLPPMPEADKTATTKVQGCTSQVWLTHEQIGEGHTFKTDSDALIVKGLLALLLALYNGKTSAEIAATNATQTLKTLVLSEHISPNRRNGFAAVEGKIKAYAAQN